MSALALPGCPRCDMLDEDPFGRTCCECRRVDREAERARIQAALRAASWHTPAGERIAVQIANENGEARP